MNFHGKAKRIDDIDLPTVGAMIGVGEDEIHAVLDVETNGSGFDSKGRPKMLFEPHVFYRQLGPTKARDRAVAQGLAYPKWRRDYPKDSYPRLIQAMLFDETAALKSASWGLGQIMGFNHVAAGFVSVQAMVEAFTQDEENHLQAMIRFIRFNKLDAALRNHDWAAFARGYNGPGFAANGYDKKLAAAYAKWRKIPDTPFPAPTATAQATKPVSAPPPAKPQGPVAPSTAPRLGIGGVVAFIGALLAMVAAWMGFK